MRVATVILGILLASPSANGFNCYSSLIPNTQNVVGRLSSRSFDSVERRDMLKWAIFGAGLGSISSPETVKAQGLAGLRERITGEKEGAPRAAERMKQPKEGDECGTYQCIQINEETFSGVKLEQFKDGGVSISVPAGWEKGSAVGAIATWTQKGASVTLRSQPADGIKFKNVQGQPATIAQSILKLDVVQTGQRVGKILDAEYLGGKARLLQPEGLLVYAMGFKTKDNKLVVDLAVRDETAYFVVCSSPLKDYDEYKGLFSTVLQSLSFK